MKRILIAFVAAYVAVYISGGLFHGLLGRDLIDQALAPFNATPMLHLNPLSPPVAITAPTAATAFFFLVAEPSRKTLGWGALFGGIVQFVAVASWHLVNKMYFPAWPMGFALVDGAWHVFFMGGLGGVVFAWSYQRGEVTAREASKDRASLEG
jgi:hypothetical protein